MLKHFEQYLCVDMFMLVPLSVSLYILTKNTYWNVRPTVRLQCEWTCNGLDLGSGTERLRYGVRLPVRSDYGAKWIRQAVRNSANNAERLRYLLNTAYVDDGDAPFSKRAREQVQDWTDGLETDRKCFIEVMDVASKWGKKSVQEDFANKACYAAKIGNDLIVKEEDMAYVRERELARRVNDVKEQRAGDALKKAIKQAGANANLEALEIKNQTAEARAESARANFGSEEGGGFWTVWERSGAPMV